MSENNVKGRTMSHFTVACRLDASVKSEDIQNELTKLLLPYMVPGGDDEDPEELKRYLRFEDIEDEHLKKYETEAVACVRLVDGRLVLPDAEECRNPNYSESLSQGLYKTPVGAEKVEIFAKELYKTFEDYMRDYCDCGARDSKTNRFGHWSNPNQKWDSWSIGGRWNGLFMVKELTASLKGLSQAGLMRTVDTDPRRADVVRIEDLDFVRIEDKTNESITRFHTECLELVNGKKWNGIEGPRSLALELGLITCKNESELTDEDRTDAYKLRRWQSQTKSGEIICDVIKATVTVAELVEAASQFCPIRTYAYLDKNGWEEPGCTGRWTCGDTKFESSAKYANKFRRWLKSGNQKDWIINVDYHV
jgi:hypothetical protein